MASNRPGPNLNQRIWVNSSSSVSSSCGGSSSSGISSSNNRKLEMKSGLFLAESIPIGLLYEDMECYTNAHISSA